MKVVEFKKELSISIDDKMVKIKPKFIYLFSDIV
jgi:hypothetical protein